MEDDLRQGRLVKPLLTELGNAYAFRMIRRPSQDHHPHAEAFCKWLVEQQAQISAQSPKLV